MTRLVDADSIPWDVDGVGTIPVVTKEEIDKMPTIDVEPVKRGKWVTNRIGMFECTSCKKMVFERSRLWQYCPYCGALMDGEEE